MKILIIGADGQLGSDLTRVFGEQAIPLVHKDIEITDPNSVGVALKKHPADVVINAAAIVKAEWCDANVEECLRVNSIGQYNVARAAAASGAISIFISSDYVFGGEKTTFVESDETHPLNAYGISKATGEELTRLAAPRHYIIRSSSLFGARLPHKGADFPRRILAQAASGEPVRVVADRAISPTYTLDLAARLKEMLERKVPFGVYHITNSGSCSHEQFAREILKQRELSADVVPITTADSGTAIKHPMSSVLENDQLKKLGFKPLRSWQEALRAYFAELDTTSG